MNTFFKPRRILKFNDLIQYELGLNESLIHSYDVEMMYKNIENHFKDRIILHPPELPFDDQIFQNKQNGYVFGLDLDITNYSKEDNVFLSQLLTLYGYFISKQINDNTVTSLIIEPKNPIEINKILLDMNVKNLYHITHKTNLGRIMTIGLAPRATETSFAHPDDRIYLIFSDNIGYIKAFKRTLARDKTGDSIKYSEFVVLSTPFDENYKYYIDEFSTRKFENDMYIGCFVNKNIPPNKLTVTNI